MNSEPKYISVRGTRMHNLKNISVDLPRNQLIEVDLLEGLSPTVSIEQKTTSKKLRCKREGRFSKGDTMRIDQRKEKELVFGQ